MHIHKVCSLYVNRSGFAHEVWRAGEMEEIENTSNEDYNMVYIILGLGVCVYKWNVICYYQLLTGRMY